MLKSSGRSSPSHGTGKMRVEFCIVSARGLHRPSLWKLHWFAVAWVDPDDKYCTRIDASGNPSPVWRTKFSAAVDADSALHIEVYSRDPLFLREKLHGSAQVSLKEFLGKKGIDNNTQAAQDLGSFQLRKKGSNKPKGFVDVSIRTSSMDKQDPGFCDTDYEGFQLAGNSNVISLSNPAAAQGLQPQPFPQPPNPAPPHYTYTHPTPYPSNYNNPSLGGPSYPPASAPAYPPPLPPPSQGGYASTSYIPRAGYASSSSSYLNLPPSAGPAAGVRPGFAAGVGAGALAAGAVMFGDEIMSGFHLPSGLSNPSLSVSIDPPF